MKEYTVVFSPEAEEQLAELYSCISEHVWADTTLRYPTAIVDYCESMKNFPHRGLRRDDIRPGLRVTNYKSLLFFGILLCYFLGKRSVS